jgi:HPt (histidine-containing phosphotransfer) domain-containing protein
MVALRRGLADGDDAAVAKSAHSLSGAGATVGATDLARLCAAVVTDAESGDLVAGRALLDAVEEELGRVRSALAARTPTP